MSRRWAVNASPLIVLVKIGRADLLTARYEELIIPAGTAEEILRGDETDPSIRWMRDEGQRFIVQNTPLCARYQRVGAHAVQYDQELEEYLLHPVEREDFSYEKWRALLNALLECTHPSGGRF